MMLVNVKLDISGYNNITFKGYRLHWTSSFLMAHLKQKVAILAFLYCGEFVKNSIDMIEVFAINTALTYLTYLPTLSFRLEQIISCV